MRADAGARGIVDLADPRPLWRCAVTLALDADYPLLDLFWTMLMVAGLALFLWTLIVVFRDLFGRADLSVGGKAAWTLFVILLPLIGSLSYLIVRSSAMGASAAAELDTGVYTRSVTGAGGYHNIHETVTRREAMAGPTRQDSA
jgi:hypothetical protein